MIRGLTDHLTAKNRATFITIALSTRARLFSLFAFLHFSAYPLACPGAEGT